MNMIRSNNYRIWIRLITLIVIITFLYQNIAWASEILFKNNKAYNIARTLAAQSLFTYLQKHGPKDITYKEILHIWDRLSGIQSIIEKNGTKGLSTLQRLITEKESSEPVDKNLLDFNGSLLQEYTDGIYYLDVKLIGSDRELVPRRIYFFKKGILLTKQFRDTVGIGDNENRIAYAIEKGFWITNIDERELMIGEIQDNVTRKLLYYVEHEVRFSYISRISQTFIDDVAYNLAQKGLDREQEEFLEIVTKVPGFFMYDALSGTFLRIHQKDFSRFVALSGMAGFTNISKEMEEFAEVELSCVAAVQNSLRVSTIESAHFWVFRQFRDEIEKLCRRFRIPIPDIRGKIDARMVEFCFTSYSRFIAARITGLSTKIFGTDIFQDRDFMYIFAQVASRISTYNLDQYMSLLSEDERQKSGISYFTVIEDRNNIKNYFKEKAGFKDFSYIEIAWWVKRQMLLYLGRHLYEIIENRYNEMVSPYPKELQEKIWFQIAMAAVRLDKNGIDPYILLLDFLPFTRFRDEVKAFAYDELRKIIDLGLNIALALKKNRIEIVSSKGRDSNQIWHFNAFKLLYSRFDPKLIIRILNLYLEMTQRGIDYRESIAPLSYFIGGILNLSKADTKYVERILKLTENLVRNGIDPALSLSFIHKYSDEPDLEQRFQLVESNIAYPRSRFLMETIIDINTVTYMQRPSSMCKIISTANKLGFKEGDLLAWTTFILWMFRSNLVKTTDEMYDFIDGYLDKCNEGISLKQSLVLLRDLLIKKLGVSNDFIKDLDTLIKLYEATSREYVSEFSEKSMDSLMEEFGLTNEDVSRLFRVTGISMTEGGDVYCTFWRVSEILLRDVDQISLPLPKQISDLLKKSEDLEKEEGIEINSIDELLEENNLHMKVGSKPKIVNRSVVINLSDGNVLFLKFCRKPEDRINLATQVHRLEYIFNNSRQLGIEGEVPKVATARGKRLFCFKTYPISYETLKDIGISPRSECIGYIISNGEEHLYLNDPKIPIEIMSDRALVEAKDLARLTKAGFFHTALIPLYHNREDERVYQWYWRYETRTHEIILGGGAGRLDRWLYNCQYPNFMLYGLTDYEHIEYDPNPDAIKMRNESGNQLLSWVLVVCSYFKNKNNFSGSEEMLKGLLRNGFNSYYRELTGQVSPLDNFIDWNELSQKMIDEMSSDKWKHDKINPDLGPFNGPFSIQELIRAIYITSTFSVLQLWRNQNCKETSTDRLGKQERDYEYLAKDVESTLFLLDFLLKSGFEENRIYEIKYDSSRLSESQQDIINTYIEILKSRVSNPDNIIVIPFRDIKRDYIIKVVCKDTNEQILGEGQININIEGELGNYPLRIIGMLNIALASSNIPNELTADQVKGYMPIINFIQNQYRAITGNELAIPNSVEEMLEVIRKISLPKPEKMDLDEVDRLNIIAKQLLISA